MQWRGILMNFYFLKIKRNVKREGEKGSVRERGEIESRRVAIESREVANESRDFAIENLEIKKIVVPFGLFLNH